MRKFDLAKNGHLHAGRYVQAYTQSMTTINKTDWKNSPMTSEAVKMTLDLSFYEGQFEKIKKGHKPQDMDDKWFIYHDNDWLFFHRSWTGQCIFKIKFTKTLDNKYQTTEFWVEQYQNRANEDNQAIVAHLIKHLLLH